MGFDPSRMDPDRIKKESIEDLQDWLQDWKPGSPQAKAASREIARRQEQQGRKLYRITVWTLVAAILAVMIGAMALLNDARLIPWFR